MNFYKPKLLLFMIITLIILTPSYSAEETRQPSIDKQVEDYIQIALENNLDISIVKENVEKKDAERREAKAMLFPKLSLQSRYTVSGGGRKIIIDPSEFFAGFFPPGYSMPAIEFPFLRPHEQETKLNVTQTLFTGGAVLNGYGARSSLHEASKCELEAKKWNKRVEVIEAYLNYLKTLELVEIKTNVLGLSKEGLELTNALFKQDKLLKNDIMRAQVNVSKAESELEEAKQQMMLAKRYFNNMLNRSPFEPVIDVDVKLDDVKNLDKFEFNNESDDIKNIKKLETEALTARSELASINHGIEAMDKLKNVAFSEYLPKVFLSVDYGWQGEEYSFTKDDDYYMASLIFQLNIFDGGAREAKVSKAAAQHKELELQRLLAKRNIGLQVEHAYLQLKTSRKKISTAVSQYKSAKENYRIVEKRYRLGMALPLDMNDALAQLDIASSQKIISLYDYLLSIYRMKNVLGSPCRSN